MPALTRWFVKSALIYLVVSLLLGLVLAASPGGTLAVLAPVYVHLFLVGWVTQMIFGVVYWMFPRHSAEAPRGSPRLGVLTYVALNAGLVARAIAEPMLALRPGGAWAALLVVSAALQWLAALAFAVNTWARVKER